MERERTTDESGRSALITGAGGGLGSGVTRVFAAAGWRVVATGRGREGSDAVRRHGASEVVHADLFDEAEVEKAVAAAAGVATAPLRAVINLVGGFAAGPHVADSDPGEFEDLLRLNLRATYLVTRAALPHLVEQGAGAIVSVASRAAVRPFAGASAYVTSKAAVIAFSKAVALEYGPRGVRSNVILPAMIDTPANRAAQPQADRSGWTDPFDIAETIHFLASDASRSVNGAAVPV